MNLSLQYILSLMRFLTEKFIHLILHFMVLINKLQLQKLSTTLMIYQRGAYCDSIKIFNKVTKYTAESVFRKKMFYIKS